MLERTDPGNSVDLDSLEAMVGTRSPFTLIKRANVLLRHVRWFDANAGDFPGAAAFDEGVVWARLKRLKHDMEPPSSATALLLAVRFLHYVLAVDLRPPVTSRRVLGSVGQVESWRQWVRQARVLTVEQVCKVHQRLELQLMRGRARAALTS